MSPRISTSGSPVRVGSVASHSASSCAERTRTALQLPWPSPASGASHALPLLLRWSATATNVPPVARTGVATVDEVHGVERGRRADRRDGLGLVEHAHLDRVVAEGVGLTGAGIGVDERPGAGAVPLVELADEELFGAVSAIAVVLHLHEGDHV